MNRDAIEAALKTVKYPGFSRDIVSFGLVREVAIENGNARVRIEVTTADPKVPAALKKEVEAALGSVDGLQEPDVEILVSKPKGSPTPQSAQDGAQSTTDGIPGVKHIIAIASGKGGVGKSTVSVNLSVALEHVLAEAGSPRSVGLMDCDIYGPSVPLMIGINGRPEVEGEKIKPLENFGVRVMSMGFLIDETTPVAWRGPMVTKAIMQFSQQVNWGELELLVVDLPPGTGDAQLTLAQTLPLDGVVIVTTPQAAAVNVARRGATLFNKVNVPYLGVVENMSYFETENGSKQAIFGEGGGQITAEGLQTELLGQIPLDPMIREGGDRGIPVVVSAPELTASTEYRKIANNLLKILKIVK